MSCYCPEVSTNLQFVPEDDIFNFRFDDPGVVNLRLSFTGMPVLFFLPKGTDTPVNDVLGFASWYRCTRDGFEFGALFG